MGCFRKWRSGHGNASLAGPTRRRREARTGGIRAFSLWPTSGERPAMINLIVMLTSAIMLALLLLWWRWPMFRVWIEAPKYSMLRQELRFDDQDKGFGVL